MMPSGFGRTNCFRCQVQTYCKIFILYCHDVSNFVLQAYIEWLYAIQLHHFLHNFCTYHFGMCCLFFIWYSLKLPMHSSLYPPIINLIHFQVFYHSNLPSYTSLTYLLPIIVVMWHSLHSILLYLYPTNAMFTSNQPSFSLLLGTQSLPVCHVLGGVYHINFLVCLSKLLSLYTVYAFTPTYLRKETALVLIDRTS